MHEMAPKWRPYERCWYKIRSAIRISIFLVTCILGNISTGLAGPNPACSATIPSDSISQIPSDSSTPTSGKSFLHNYGPWIIASAAGASLFAFDKDIKTYSQRRPLHTAGSDNFFKPFHKVGQGWEYAIAIPLFAGHGLICKKNKSMVVAGELVTALAAQVTITQLFKLSFGRLRPFQNNSPSKFFKGGRSFFSGDASTAFTFATIVSKNFPSQKLDIIGIHCKLPLVPIILYSTAGMVGVQRIYSDQHWSSDVYYGMLAGYAVGSIAVHYGRRVHLKGFAIVPGRPPMMMASFTLINE